MKKIFILFSVIMVSNVQNSFALPGIDAGSVNSSSVRDMRLHDVVSRNREKSAIVQKEKKNVSSNQVTEELKTVLSDLKSVTFVNNSSISSGELFKVIENHINKPMSDENISAIRNEIMRYYQKKGYYSAIAIVSSEDNQTGELVLDIKEGGKNSIIIQDEY